MDSVDARNHIIPKRSKSNFSLKQQYSGKLTGDENTDNNQLRHIVLIDWCTTKFSKLT